MTGTEKTNKLVLTALMVCLVLLATYIIKIPSPFTQGYVHLGDTMIFLSVLLLGKKGGAAAAGLGSCRPSRRIRRLRSMDVSDKGTHGVHNGSFHRGGHKEEKTSCQDRIGSGCGDRGNGTGRHRDGDRICRS